MPDWTAISDVVIALCTIAAVLIAAWQLRENRKVASESFARQCWIDYLKIGLDYPELGETRVALSNYIGSTPKSLSEGNTKYSQRYLWFLTIVLDACENVIRYLPKKDWEVTLIEQVRYHRPVLNIIWDSEWSRFYSAELDRIVRTALESPVLYDESAPLFDDPEPLPRTMSGKLLVNRRSRREQQ